MNEREIAYNCLVKILNDKQFSNIVLKNNKEVTPLVTQLVYGTLRNYRLVRNIWNKYTTKPPVAKIAILLDMAVFELVLMDKPNYATVNEIVEISKKIKGGNYTSFVNAVLRKVNTDDLNVDDLAIRTSHPDWLVKMWNAHYGKEITEKICEKDNVEARISLRVNTLVTSKQQLLKDERFTSGSTSQCVYYDGNVLESDYFKNCEVIIQSESSQLAVETLGVQKDWKVLDLCAAPGTKTVQIATNMENTGLVIANDLYDFRVNLIKENVDKYDLKNIIVTNFDGRDVLSYYEPNTFDAILLDAPCSGLGTLRHKPEIKITTTPNDLDNIVSLQKQLLDSCYRLLKKDGVLVYSTCTLNKKENEKQVAKFLSEHPGFKLESERTIFPFDFDSDGFYIAKMIRENIND